MNKFEPKHFNDIVDEIFSKKTRQESLDTIEQYNKFWMQMQSGSQGFSGKKAVNNMTTLTDNFEGDDLHDKMVIDKLEKKVLPQWGNPDLFSIS